jgi:hypothetical protein
MMITLVWPWFILLFHAALTRLMAPGRSRVLAVAGLTAAASIVLATTAQWLAADANGNALQIRARPRVRSSACSVAALGQ